MKKKFLFVLLLFAGLAHGQVNLTLGLKAYYPFSGNANDASGNSNNPIANNATLTADRLGIANSAYHFDGSSSFIRVPNSPTLNTGATLSVCAWVRPMGYYMGNCHGNSIMMKGDNDYLTGNYYMRFDDGFYSNYTNCSTPSVDIVHENFYGSDAAVPAPGYTPYIQTNQWYSVIVTYDGATVKLYVNCELKFSGPQVSTTFTNGYDLFLGTLNNPSFPYWFNGDMDEVRIYDRAINQDEVNVLGGCAVLPGISDIINDYTPVLAFNPCDNKITVEDGIKYNVGDTVLLIQMKGAVIDSTNSAAFGTMVDYKNAGNYEYNYVKSKSGNIIELKNKLTRQYDVPFGKVQLIRVPYYSANINITGTLTCLPWDGSKGGVLVFNVKDTVIMNGDMDVTGKGFRGGNTVNVGIATLSCFNDNYFLDSTSLSSSRKGEGITTVGPDKLNGRGPLANGGGGGNGHNSGGGGGSNIAAGGFGGYQLLECGGGIHDNRGLGGIPLIYSNASNKIFLGGGGGAGHKDGLPTEFLSSAGGDGGGIIIVSTKYLKTNNFNISANGAHGKQCDTDGFPCLHDGMGGGGGGGMVLLNIGNYLDNHKENVTGGKGADLTLFTNAAGHVAPGGGGGAGAVWFNSPTLPPGSTVTNAGGVNGTIVLDSNNPFGSTPGQNGTNLFNLNLPIDNIPFVKNIDSVRIKETANSCSAFNFLGFGYTNTNPIASWHWNFGDGGTASTQNTSHNYLSTGTYTVTLVATDINGCKDSITKNVNTILITAEAGVDTAFCSNGPVSHMLHGSSTGGTGYSWTPAALLDNNTLQNPTATVTATTTFYLTASNVLGCTAIDSVKIIVNPVPLVSTINNASICHGDSILMTTNSNAQNNQWAPALSVNNANTSSPWFTDTVSQMMIITGTNATTGCFAKDTVTISIKPLPIVQSIPDSATCGPKLITLTTTGAQSYSWTPAAGLSSTNISNPVFNATTPQVYTYYVTGTGTNLCTAKDTVNITIHAVPVVSTITDTTICRGDTLLLLTSSNAQSNQWTPNLSVNTPNISSPYFTDSLSQMMIITGTNSTGCFSADTVNVNVKPIPTIHSIADSATCGPKLITLTTTGAQSYSWTPAAGLSSTNISNPVFNATTPQVYTYYVTGTGANLCTAKDTVNITIHAVPVVSTITDTTICRGDTLLLLSSSNAQSNQWTPNLSVNTPNIGSPYFTDTLSQIMIITGTNTTGCFSADTVNVNVKPIPTIHSIADSATCGPKLITLTTTGAQSYSWTPALGLSSTNISNPVFNGTNTQVYTYYVTGTGINLCTAKDTVNITIHAVPAVSTIVDTSICRGDTLLLLSNSNAQNNHWSPVLSVNNPNLTTPYFTDTIPQQLIITGMNTTGCFSTDTVNVNVKPLPIVKTIEDTTTCTTNSITLFTTGAQTYSWSPAAGLSNPGSPNPVFTGTGIHFYYVTGTAANGCINKDSVRIQIKDKPVFSAPAAKTICAKQSVQLNGNNDPAFEYAWSPAAYLNNPGIINPMANPPITTTYTLLITDHVCIADTSFNVRVTVNPLPAVHAAKSNDIDCLSPESHLTASGATHFTWSPSTALNSTTVYNPVASPPQNTQYIVTGTDNNGCTNKDSVFVYVKGGQYFGFNIPNAFTPNADNINDCFGVQRWGIIEDFLFMIYNRWGEKVFETHNKSECWNGYYKGMPAESGNYVYFLKGKTLCGEVSKKGNVLLIR